MSKPVPENLHEQGLLRAFQHGVSKGRAEAMEAVIVDLRRRGAKLLENEPHLNLTHALVLERVAEDYERDGGLAALLVGSPE